MSKIFVIIGKSATGKDSIFKKIVDNNIGIKTVIGYTTRPVRQGEQNGVEYYFVTEEEMKRLDEEGRIIECRSYNTVHGWWHYFTADDGQIDLSDGSYLIIGTLAGFRKLREYYGSGAVVPIYIEADNKERLLRAVRREEQQGRPNYMEVCRRYLADEDDFADIKIRVCGIKKTYFNHDINACLDQIIEDMKKLM